MCESIFRSQKCMTTIVFDAFFWNALLGSKIGPCVNQPINTKIDFGKCTRENPWSNWLLPLWQWQFLLLSFMLQFFTCIFCILPNFPVLQWWCGSTWYHLWKHTKTLTLRQTAKKMFDWFVLPALPDFGLCLLQLDSVSPDNSSRFHLVSLASHFLWCCFNCSNALTESTSWKNLFFCFWQCFRKSLFVTSVFAQVKCDFSDSFVLIWFCMCQFSVCTVPCISV